MGRFAAMLGKEWRVLFRDVGQVLILFLMPIIFIAVMGEAMSGVISPDDTLVVPVVNLDRGRQGDALLNALAQLRGVEVRQETAKDLAAVRDRVGSNTPPYAIVIPPDFSGAVAAGESPSLTVVTRSDAPAQQLVPVERVAQAAADQAATEAAAGRQVASDLRRVASQAAEQATRATLAGVQETLRASLPPAAEQALAARLSGAVGHGQPAPAPPPADGARVAALPRVNTLLRVESTTGGALAKSPDTWQTNVPGYLITFMFFIAGAIASSILSERESGVMRRVLTAPVSRLGVLGSKTVPFYVINLLQAVLLFAVAHFAFGMALGAHPWSLALISAVLALSSTGVGLIMGAVTRSQGQANGIVPLVALTLAAVGGCLVPLQIMPAAMRLASRFTPDGWALRAYQDVLVQGFGPQQLAQPLAVLAGFGVASIVAGVALFSRDSRPA